MKATSNMKATSRATLDLNRKANKCFKNIIVTEIAATMVKTVRY